MEGLPILGILSLSLSPLLEGQKVKLAEPVLRTAYSTHASHHGDDGGTSASFSEGTGPFTVGSIA